MFSFAFTFPECCIIKYENLLLPLLLVKLRRFSLICIASLMETHLACCTASIIILICQSANACVFIYQPLRLSSVCTMSYPQSWRSAISLYMLFLFTPSSSYSVLSFSTIWVAFIGVFSSVVCINCNTLINFSLVSVATIIPLKFNQYRYISHSNPVNNYTLFYYIHQH